MIDLPCGTLKSTNMGKMYDIMLILVYMLIYGLMSL